VRKGRSTVVGPGPTQEPGSLFMNFLVNEFSEVTPAPISWRVVPCAIACSLQELK
jgi:hypothetical protein